jgi:hypothetical protein
MKCWEYFVDEDGVRVSCDPEAMDSNGAYRLCPTCKAAHEAEAAEFLREYRAETPLGRLRVTDPERAREMYRDDMIDAGRGHLLREDER